MLEYLLTHPHSAFVTSDKVSPKSGSSPDATKFATKVGGYLAADWLIKITLLIGRKSAHANFVAKFVSLCDSSLKFGLPNILFSVLHIQSEIT